MPLDYCNNKGDSGMLKTCHSLCKQNEMSEQSSQRQRDQHRTKKAIWKIPVIN